MMNRMSLKEPGQSASATMAMKWLQDLAQKPRFPKEPTTGISASMRKLSSGVDRVVFPCIHKY